MFIKYMSFIVAASCLFIAQLANAQDFEVEFHDISTSWDCPADLEFRRTNDRISIIVNELWGVTSQNGMENSICRLSIPIHFPSGEMCWVNEVSFEGNTRVGNGGRSYVVMAHRLAGAGGNVRSDTYDQPGAYTFEITTPFRKPIFNGGFSNSMSNIDTGSPYELDVTIYLGAVHMGFNGSTRIEITSGSVAPSVEFGLECGR